MKILKKFLNFDYIEDDVKDFNEDISFLIKRKKLTKTSSLILAIAILLSGLGSDSKREKKNTEDNSANYYNYMTFRVLDLPDLKPNDEENKEVIISEEDNVLANNAIEQQNENINESKDEGNDIHEDNNIHEESKIDEDNNIDNENNTHEENSVPNEINPSTDSEEETNEIEPSIPNVDDGIVFNDWGLPITYLVLDESVLVSNEEKIAWILEHFNLTLEQFNIIKATCRHEGGPKYFDGFTIINNIYDRTISYLWSPKEEQQNLFYQTTRSGQYNSYFKGYYKQFLDLTPEECPAVQAVIDFLYYQSTGCPVIVHPFLNFSKASGYQFTETDIRFRNPIKEDDYITRNFICISKEQLGEIAAAGGFANYYLNTLNNNYVEENDNDILVPDSTIASDSAIVQDDILESEENQEQNNFESYPNSTPEKSMQRIRRLY